MSGPDADLTVHGGAGGTVAHLEDLERCAAVLVQTGRALLAAAAVLARVAADPVLLASTVASPGTAAGAEAALLAATAGPRGVLPTGARLEGLGRSLQAAAATYATADRVVDGAVRTVELAAAGAVGRLAGLALAPALPALTLAGVVAGRTFLPASGTAAAGATGGPDADGAAVGGLEDRLGRSTDALERLAGMLPTALDGALGATPGATGLAAAAAPGSWPLRDATAVAALLAGAARATPLLRETSTSGVSVGPRRPTAPPAGVRDLLARVADCYPAAGAPPGTVRVESVTASGARSWVVAIPGTQVWSPRAGAAPFDLTANVHALAQRRTAAAGVVVRALRAAGARPGEPVLLAGHSQGGMLAAGLAADPAFRREFAVTHLVTAGAPVALYRVPPEVRVLSVEHDGDVVPRLDGARNPDRPRWLTVSRSATAPGTGVDLVAAHEASAYVRTGALVDGSRDPAVVRWREELAPFLDRPGARAEVLSMTGRRTGTS